MPVHVDILAPDERVVASVSLPERELFWSDGAFAPGEGFAAYADFFHDLEDASRRFQAAAADDEAAVLAELAELWSELNHLRIRERGVPGRLTDVGLLLEGDQARIRYWAETHDTLSDAQLDELEALIGADDREFAPAARAYLPRLIAEVRRARET